MKDILKCPKCGEVLSKYHLDHMITYRCVNNHSYDLNKKGYLHLLLANQMNSKDPGDNNEMMEARKLFLEKGYYETLRTELSRLIKDNDFVLDLGCGEGYYTKALCDNNNFVLGTDISKSMILSASKKLKENYNLFFVLSSNSHLPFIDHSIDAILNCFAPIDINEAKRVLKDNGLIYKVIPGEYHLYELKNLIYDEVYLNKETTLINKENESKIQLKEIKRVKYTIKLNSKEDIKNLMMMTPYYFKTKKENLARIENLTEINVTLDFVVHVYSASSAHGLF